MADFNQTSREFNSASAELLLTDLDVAMTFMDVAETTHDPETARRNQQNARHAYNTVVGFIPRLVLTEAEEHALEGKLVLLKARLAAAGCEV